MSQLSSGSKLIDPGEYKARRTYQENAQELLAYDQKNRIEEYIQRLKSKEKTPALTSKKMFFQQDVQKGSTPDKKLKTKEVTVSFQFNKSLLAAGPPPPAPTERFKQSALLFDQAIEEKRKNLKDIDKIDIEFYKNYAKYQEQIQEYVEFESRIEDLFYVGLNKLLMIGVFYAVGPAAIGWFMSSMSGATIPLAQSTVAVHESQTKLTSIITELATVGITEERIQELQALQATEQGILVEKQQVAAQKERELTSSKDWKKMAFDFVLEVFGGLTMFDFNHYSKIVYNIQAQTLLLAKEPTFAAMISSGKNVYSFAFNGKNPLTDTLTADDMKGVLPNGTKVSVKIGDNVVDVIKEYQKAILQLTNLMVDRSAGPLLGHMFKYNLDTLKQNSLDDVIQTCKDIVSIFSKKENDQDTNTMLGKAKRFLGLDTLEQTTEYAKSGLKAKQSLYKIGKAYKTYRYEIDKIIALVSSPTEVSKLAQKGVVEQYLDRATHSQVLRQNFIGFFSNMLPAKEIVAAAASSGTDDTRGFINTTVLFFREQTKNMFSLDNFVGTASGIAFDTIGNSVSASVKGFFPSFFKTKSGQTSVADKKKRDKEQKEYEEALKELRLKELRSGKSMDSVLKIMKEFRIMNKPGDELNASNMNMLEYAYRKFTKKLQGLKLTNFSYDIVYYGGLSVLLSGFGEVASHVYRPAQTGYAQERNAGITTIDYYGNGFEPFIFFLKTFFIKDPTTLLAQKTQEFDTKLKELYEEVYDTYIRKAMMDSKFIQWIQKNVRNNTKEKVRRVLNRFYLGIYISYVLEKSLDMFVNSFVSFFTEFPNQQVTKFQRAIYESPIMSQYALLGLNPLILQKYSRPEGWSELFSMYSKYSLSDIYSMASTSIAENGFLGAKMELEARLQAGDTDINDGSIRFNFKEGFSSIDELMGRVKSNLKTNNQQIEDELKLKISEINTLKNDIPELDEKNIVSQLETLRRKESLTDSERVLKEKLETLVKKINELLKYIKEKHAEIGPKQRVLEAELERLKRQTKSSEVKKRIKEIEAELISLDGLQQIELYLYSTVSTYLNSNKTSVDIANELGNVSVNDIIRANALGGESNSRNFFSSFTDRITDLFNAAERSFANYLYKKVNSYIGKRSYIQSISIEILPGIYTYLDEKKSLTFFDEFTNYNNISNQAEYILINHGSNLSDEELTELTKSINNGESVKQRYKQIIGDGKNLSPVFLADRAKDLRRQDILSLKRRILQLLNEGINTKEEQDRIKISTYYRVKGHIVKVSPTTTPNPDDLFEVATGLHIEVVESAPESDIYSQVFDNIDSLKLSIFTAKLKNPNKPFPFKFNFDPASYQLLTSRRFGLFGSFYDTRIVDSLEQALIDAARNKVSLLLGDDGTGLSDYKNHPLYNILMEQFEKNPTFRQNFMDEINLTFELEEVERKIKDAELALSKDKRADYDRNMAKLQSGSVGVIDKDLLDLHTRKSALAEKIRNAINARNLSLPEDLLKRLKMNQKDLLNKYAEDVHVMERRLQKLKEDLEKQEDCPVENDNVSNLLTENRRLEEQLRIAYSDESDDDKRTRLAFLSDLRGEVESFTGCSNSRQRNNMISAINSKLEQIKELRKTLAAVTKFPSLVNTRTLFESINMLKDSTKIIENEGKRIIDAARSFLLGLEDLNSPASNIKEKHSKILQFLIKKSLRNQDNYKDTFQGKNKLQSWWDLLPEQLKLADSPTWDENERILTEGFRENDNDIASNEDERKEGESADDFYKRLQSLFVRVSSRGSRVEESLLTVNNIYSQVGTGSNGFNNALKHFQTYIFDKILSIQTVPDGLVLNVEGSPEIKAAVAQEEENRKTIRDILEKYKGKVIPDSLTDEMARDFDKLKAAIKALNSGINEKIRLHNIKVEGAILHHNKIQRDRVRAALGEMKIPTLSDLNKMYTKYYTSLINYLSYFQNIDSATNENVIQIQTILDRISRLMRLREQLDQNLVDYDMNIFLLQSTVLNADVFIRNIPADLKDFDTTTVATNLEKYSNALLRIKYFSLKYELDLAMNVNKVNIQTRWKELHKIFMDYYIVQKRTPPDYLKTIFDPLAKRVLDTSSDIYTYSIDPFGKSFDTNIILISRVERILQAANEGKIDLDNNGGNTFDTIYIEAAKQMITDPNIDQNTRNMINVSIQEINVKNAKKRYTDAKGKSETIRSFKSGLDKTTPPEILAAAAAASDDATRREQEAERALAEATKLLEEAKRAREESAAEAAARKAAEEARTAAEKAAQEAAEAAKKAAQEAAEEEAKRKAADDARKAEEERKAAEEARKAADKEAATKLITDYLGEIDRTEKKLQELLQNLERQLTLIPGNTRFKILIAKVKKMLADLKDTKRTINSYKDQIETNAPDIISELQNKNFNDKLFGEFLSDINTKVIDITTKSKIIILDFRSKLPSLLTRNKELKAELDRIASKKKAYDECDNRFKIGCLPNLNAKEQEQYDYYNKHAKKEYTILEEQIRVLTEMQVIFNELNDDLSNIDDVYKHIDYLIQSSPFKQNIYAMLDEFTRVLSSDFDLDDREIDDFNSINDTLIKKAEETIISLTATLASATSEQQAETNKLLAGLRAKVAELNKLKDRLKNGEALSLEEKSTLRNVVASAYDQLDETRERRDVAANIQQIVYREIRDIFQNDIADFFKTPDGSVEMYNFGFGEGKDTVTAEEFKERMSLIYDVSNLISFKGIQEHSVKQQYFDCFVKGINCGDLTKDGTLQQELAEIRTGQKTRSENFAEYMTTYIMGNAKEILIAEPAAFITLGGYVSIDKRIQEFIGKEISEYSFWTVAGLQLGQAGTTLAGIGSMLNYAGASIVGKLNIQTSNTILHNIGGGQSYIWKNLRTLDGVTRGYWSTFKEQGVRTITKKVFQKLPPGPAVATAIGTTLGAVGGSYAGWKLGNIINDYFKIENAKARTTVLASSTLTGGALGATAGFYLTPYVLPYLPYASAAALGYAGYELGGLIASALEIESKIATTGLQVTGAVAGAALGYYLLTGVAVGVGSIVGSPVLIGGAALAGGAILIGGIFMGIGAPAAAIQPFVERSIKADEEKHRPGESDEDRLKRILATKWTFYSVGTDTYKGIEDSYNSVKEGLYTRLVTLKNTNESAFKDLSEETKHKLFEKLKNPSTNKDNWHNDFSNTELEAISRILITESAAASSNNKGSQKGGGKKEYINSVLEIVEKLQILLGILYFPLHGKGYTNEDITLLIFIKLTEFLDNLSITIVNNTNNQTMYIYFQGFFDMSKIDLDEWIPVKRVVEGENTLITRKQQQLLEMAEKERAEEALRRQKEEDAVRQANEERKQLLLAKQKEFIYNYFNPMNDRVKGIFTQGGKSYLSAKKVLYNYVIPISLLLKIYIDLLNEYRGQVIANKLKFENDKTHLELIEAEGTLRKKYSIVLTYYYEICETIKKYKSMTEEIIRAYPQLNTMKYNDDQYNKYEKIVKMFEEFPDSSKIGDYIENGYIFDKENIDKTFKDNLVVSPSWFFGSLLTKYSLNTEVSTASKYEPFIQRMFNNTLSKNVDFRDYDKQAIYDNIKQPLEKVRVIIDGQPLGKAFTTAEIKRGTRSKRGGGVNKTRVKRKTNTYLD